MPFFLQSQPALATGRGERIEPLESFPALRGAAFVLIHPGFGIATAWAYQQLARFPHALNGRPGRAQKLVSLLQGADLRTAGAEFYNSLEAPALEKYPLLALFQEFLRANGAAATLDVRQRFDHLCRRAGPGGWGRADREVQGQVWPDELDGRGLRLTRSQAAGAKARKE